MSATRISVASATGVERMNARAARNSGGTSNVRSGTEGVDGRGDDVKVGVFAACGVRAVARKEANWGVKLVVKAAKSW